MQQSGPHRLCLSDLKHGPTTDDVCVRVMRKWLYDATESGGSASYIGLVLADEKVRLQYLYSNITSSPNKGPTHAVTSNHTNRWYG
jgi:hypothetical protein